MKNRTNGAAPQAAKTTHTNYHRPTARRLKISPAFEKILEDDRLKRMAIYRANEAGFNAKRKQLTIEIGLDDYGLLCAGAAYHDTTVEELIAAWLNETVCDWSNNSFIFED
jgi:hypothetical protein